MTSRRYALTELRSCTGHVEQRPAEPVVDARDERLLVLPLLVAGDHVGLAGEDRARRGVGMSSGGTGGRPDRRRGRVRASARYPVRSASAMPRPRRCRTPRRNGYCGWRVAEHGPRGVDRAVVDDDDLVAIRCPANAVAACSMNSGRFAASSLAGTSTLTSTSLGRRCRCGRSESADAPSDGGRQCAVDVGMRMASYALPHPGRQHAQLVAVLGDGAAGDLHAAVLENVHDRLIGQRALGVLFLDQLLDLAP